MNSYNPNSFKLLWIIGYCRCYFLYVIFTSNRTGVEVDQSDFLPAALHQSEVEDTSHTGQVGTALYVAPELNTCLLKAMYNQVSFISDVFSGYPIKKKCHEFSFLVYLFYYSIPSKWFVQFLWTTSSTFLTLPRVLLVAIGVIPSVY